MTEQTLFLLLQLTAIAMALVPFGVLLLGVAIYRLVRRKPLHHHVKAGLLFAFLFNVLLFVSSKLNLALTAAFAGIGLAAYERAIITALAFAAGVLLSMPVAAMIRRRKTRAEDGPAIPGPQHLPVYLAVTLIVLALAHKGPDLAGVPDGFRLDRQATSSGWTVVTAEGSYAGGEAGGSGRSARLSSFLFPPEVQHEMYVSAMWFDGSLAVRLRDERRLYRIPVGYRVYEYRNGEFVPAEMNVSAEQLYEFLRQPLLSHSVDDLERYVANEGRPTLSLGQASPSPNATP